MAKLKFKQWYIIVNKKYKLNFEKTKYCLLVKFNIQSKHVYYIIKSLILSIVQVIDWSSMLILFLSNL